MPDTILDTISRVLKHQSGLLFLLLLAPQIVSPPSRFFGPFQKIGGKVLGAVRADIKAKPLLALIAVEYGCRAEAANLITPGWPPSRTGIIRESFP